MSTLISPRDFEADRQWLQALPGMTPWESGCERVRNQLDAWIVRYLQETCGRPAELDQPGTTEYRARLWECWRFHWQAALENRGVEMADGWQVAEMVAAGRAVNGRGSLGGNPLRDVVLAVAVLNREMPARQRLYDEYRPLALGQAAKVGRRFVVDTDWWDDLVGKLAGDLQPPGKLCQFTGRCSLASWLATVVRNHVLNLAKSKRGESLPDDERIAATHDDAPWITQECAELFRRMVRDALAQLDADDRVLLALLFVDRLDGKEAAAALGIHAGNVSRRKQKALDELRRGLARAAAGSASYEECLSHLMTDPHRRDFAEVLVEALQRADAQVRVG